MLGFAVHPRGTDPNGRTIFATDYMWAWWRRVCGDLGFEPTIVQGAFMGRAGGGAAASAGYHDGGGCFDLRVWDLTPEQVTRTIRALRRFGAAAWLRDAKHGGFDPHIHFVLGTDKPLNSGAAFQWQAYRNGRDGLSSNGPDYHWRPTPLVLTPPEEDDMFEDKDRERAKRTEEKLDALGAAEKRRNQADRKRDQKLIKRVTGVDVSVEKIEQALAEELE